MLTERELVTTFEMVKNEHLDVRTVTLGINLFDCASDDCARFRTKIYDRIASLAAPLVETCTRIGDRYGIPVVNKRISVSPIAACAAPFSPEEMVEIACSLKASLNIFIIPVK